MNKRPSRLAKDVANQSLNKKKTKYQVVDLDVSDSDQSSDDDMELPTSVPVAASSNNIIDEDEMDTTDEEDAVDNSFAWNKTILQQPVTLERRIFSPAADPSQTPRQYFHQFFDESLVEHIAYQTNLYSTQKTGTSINCTKEEMRKVIGIYLVSGIVTVPRYRMYWSTKTLFPLVADAMSQKRFEKVKRYLHFNDNSAETNVGDKLSKVRSLIEKVRANCLAVEPEVYHSVDEQMIATKGRSTLRQYMPKKPNKWGIKVFTRCGSTGLTYDFMVYTGKVHPPAEVDIGMSGNVVVHLTSTLPQNCGFLVYFDNFFTSMALLNFLRSKQIFAIGTFRSNRLKEAKEHVAIQQLKKSKIRGSFDWVSNVSTGITVVSWVDNNVVTVASTYIGADLGEPVRRWSTEKKDYLQIPCPLMITEYNKFMGGVDLADMLLSLYPIKFRSHKNYFYIFFYLLKTAVNNSWLLYRRHCQQLGISYKPLLIFQEDISHSLIACDPVPPRKRGRPSNEERNATDITEPNKSRSRPTAMPVTSIQRDGFGHRSLYDIGKRMRCRHCKTGFTDVKCLKCNVYLCFTRSRNCFDEFHC
jgi:hypothetical protein